MKFAGGLAPLRKKPPPTVDYTTATFVPFSYRVVQLYNVQIGCCPLQCTGSMGPSINR